jgi:hypothetical protein
MPIYPNVDPQMPVDVLSEPGIKIPILNSNEKCG